MVLHTARRYVEALGAYSRIAERWSFSHAYVAACHAPRPARGGARACPPLHSSEAGARGMSPTCSAFSTASGSGLRSKARKLALPLRGATTPSRKSA